METVKKFFLNNKKEILVFFLIFIAAAFVRLYRIEDYLHFLGDEGRDVLVVKRILVDHKFTLLGPITSVGSMYLGPIYYYFMTPFLWLFGMNPVGPAVMIVLLSLATITLVYLLCSEFFDWPAAVIASSLYAFSPLVIVYSRFSWNPNAVPFFATLIIYGLLKTAVKKKDYWFWIIGLSLGVILQLHYLGLIFIPIILLVLLLYQKDKLPNILKVVIGTLIMLSPYLAFEIRHGFPNIQTVFRFLTKGGEAATFSFGKFPLIVSDVVTRSFWRIIVVDSNFFSKVLIVFLLVSLFFIFKDRKFSKKKRALIVLLLWFVIAIVSFGLYQGSIYDYYMVQFFPFPALICGIVFAWYIDKGSYYRIIAVVAVLLILFFQMKNSPILKEPNRLLPLTIERAQFIFDLVGKDPYNFALITGSNSDHAYRYFLELWGIAPVTIENPQIDPERKTVTNQLIVICEVDLCEPLGNPLWEIAGFGPAEIAGSWSVEGVTIFRLIHSY